MISSNYNPILIVLTIFLVAMLSSCTFTKVHNQSVDIENTILENSSIMTPRIDIDSVLFQGKAVPFRPYDRFESITIPDTVDPRTDIEYAGVFNNFETNLLSGYNYYYKMAGNKPTFMKLALEYLLEEPYLSSSKTTKIKANILQFDISSDITFDEAIFIQTLSIDFSYYKDGEQINFLAQSIDTSSFRKAHLSKLDDLVYTGVNNCASQFSDFFCQANDIDTINRNKPYKTNNNYRSLSRRNNFSSNPYYTRLNPVDIFKPHPFARIGGFYVPSSNYGIEISAFFKQKDLGSYTPSATLKYTDEFLSVGFAPLFYTNKFRKGFYFIASVDLIYFYSKTYNSYNYNYYNSYNYSYKSDAEWALSSILGFGWRLGVIDLRFGGIGFLKLTDNSYVDDDTKVFLGVGLCF